MKVALTEGIKQEGKIVKILLSLIKLCVKHAGLNVTVSGGSEICKDGKSVG